MIAALLQAWLVAWLLALSISLGATANLMVHALTGGRWGDAIHAPLDAAARIMPVLAVLFLPILLGVASLYPWTTHPGRWLNVPFFVLRSVVYLATWIVLARGYRRWPALGLVAYGFTMTLAAFDWVASLMPDWHASGFGLLVITGQMLGGFAFGVAMLAASLRRQGRAFDPQLGIDLGNLMLMYVLVWAYLAYTQLVVIWSENLPHEISWYLPRMATGWAALGIFLVVFHFVVPFAILLSRAAKRSVAVIGALAILLLVGRAADVVWLVIPSVHHG